MIISDPLPCRGFRFIFQGFPYGFKPLDMNQHDGMQHVASLSLNQYNYLALKYGFMEAEYGIVRKIKGYSPIHNRKDLLLGRLLFMVFSK